MRNTLMTTSRILLFVLTVTSMSSCAFHSGMLSSNAVLMNNQFKIAGIVIGESESMKILGIGGLAKDALVYKAKQDLYEHASLKPGQGLTNMTVDFKREFYLIFFKTKVTVTAEIVDFNADAQNTISNEYRLINRNGLSFGDSVFVKIGSSYRQGIIKKLEIKKVTIEDFTFKTSALYPYEKVFKLQGSFHYKSEQYSVGDETKMTVVTNSKQPGNQKPKTITVKVMGLSGQKALLFRPDNSQFFEINID